METVGLGRAYKQNACLFDKRRAQVRKILFEMVLQVLVGLFVESGLYAFLTVCILYFFVSYTICIAKTDFRKSCFCLRRSFFV